MSTIRVDNFGPSAGGTTYSADGIAKVWVNFNGTGTAAARDSLNLSSLTDNGTGDYTVNFSNAFGAGDYSVGAYCAHASGGGAHIITGDSTTGNPASSSIRVRSKNQATTLFDPSTAGLNMMGDLA